MTAKKKKTGKIRNDKVKVRHGKLAREINMEQVLYWIDLGATIEEIAGSFRIAHDTLERRIKEEYDITFGELKRILGNGAKSKIVLRRNQLELSKHNATMAIWLGKQWLGQQEKITNEQIIKNNSVEIYIPSNDRDNDGN